MHNFVSRPTLTRRRFTQLSEMAAGSLALSGAARAAAASDVTLEIVPHNLEALPKHHIRTVAYNGKIPRRLFRMRDGEPQSVEIRNLTKEFGDCSRARPLPAAGYRSGNGRRHADDCTWYVDGVHHDPQACRFPLVSHVHVRGEESHQGAIRWAARFRPDLNSVGRPASRPLLTVHKRQRDPLWLTLPSKALPVGIVNLEIITR